ncbi:hypothetical protein Tco_0106232, partial [Tanacetum coccineum]
MVPRTVLMKSCLVSINTARKNILKTTVSVNTARQVNTAHSKTTVNAGRPMVNTVKDKNVNAARPKVVVNVARPKAVVNAVKGNNVKLLRPQLGNPQMDLQDKGVIDSRCSRHMTWNVSYLTDYEKNRWRICCFWREPQRGKITGKGTQSNGFADPKSSQDDGSKPSSDDKKKVDEYPR